MPAQRARLVFPVPQGLRELAARGLRGIAFDLPGLGLADRPATFDYTWTGLGRFRAAAVDALGLDRFHLVVHDIGGPAGFELCAALTDLTGRPATAHTEPEISARSPQQTTRRPSAPIRRSVRSLPEALVAQREYRWSRPSRDIRRSGGKSKSADTASEPHPNGHYERVLPMLVEPVR